MKNSTTIILPAWFETLEKLELSSRMMPRDVTTRWNSTFDMLVFAVEYQVAINKISGDRALKLRKFELNAEEWEIAVQLRNVLKVHV